MQDSNSENKNFCQCGCGVEIPFISKHRHGPQRFKHGHSKGNLGNKKYCLVTYTKLCGCGCGEAIPMFTKQHHKLRRFKHGHYRPIAEINGMWKGGHYMDQGYVLIRQNCKTVRENRHVFEEYYKCCLLSWGVVHHINGIKTDNRIENLLGMTISQHVKLHNPPSLL